jgi:hypothetical protein
LHSTITSHFFEGSAWQNALLLVALLSKMLPLNVVPWTATISACEKEGRWTKLLGKQHCPSLFWLVVWNMAFIFHFIYGIIIPTDELIFFRGVGIPPTSIAL